MARIINAIFWFGVRLAVAINFNAFNIRRDCSAKLLSPRSCGSP